MASWRRAPRACCRSARVTGVGVPTNRRRTWFHPTRLAVNRSGLAPSSRLAATIPIVGLPTCLHRAITEHGVLRAELPARGLCKPDALGAPGAGDARSSGTEPAIRIRDIMELRAAMLHLTYQGARYRLRP